MTEPSNLRDAAEVWDAAWDAWAENDCSAAAAIIEADRAAVEAEVEAEVEAATIAKVVAWLRETARLFSVEIMASEGRKDTSELLHHKRACTLAANAIEAGEWKQ